jgi:hypothetical protein
MICPDCYAHVRPASRLSVREKLIGYLTPYRTYRCDECRWRGVLTNFGSSTRQHFKQSTLGWLIGIVLALGIAWFVADEMQAHNLKPSAASAEMKWDW